MPVDRSKLVEYPNARNLGRSRWFQLTYDPVVDVAPEDLLRDPAQWDSVADLLRPGDSVYAYNEASLSVGSEDDGVVLQYKGSVYVPVAGKDALQLESLGVERDPVGERVLALLA